MYRKKHMLPTNALNRYTEQTIPELPCIAEK